MIIVSNTSPLTNLAAIGQFDLLRRLYGRVHVAHGVWDELNADGKRWPGCDEVAAAHWIEHHAVQNQALVTALQRDLDRGEAESIALALELGADLVLLDEREGRRAAKRLGLRMATYVDPPFGLHYRVEHRLGKAIGVISISRSQQKPHMIAKPIGGLHEGTCYTRKGSINALARSADIRQMVEEMLGEEPHPLSPRWKWSREDINKLRPLARAVLWAFVQTGKAELSMEELKRLCLDELRDARVPGKTLAGTLKTFYARRNKDQLVAKNPVTGYWRFKLCYREIVESALREMGYT